MRSVSKHSSSPNEAMYGKALLKFEDLAFEKCSKNKTDKGLTNFLCLMKIIEDLIIDLTVKN